MRVELGDVEDVLALFCEGIAGRRLHIKPTRELVSRRLELSDNDVMQAPDAIYLPETIEAADSSAYRVLVLEQIGYHECGTFRFSLETLRERLADEQFATAAVASNAASDLGRFFASFDNAVLARRLFRLIEQARVFAYLFRTYPGILSHAHRYFAYLRQSLSEQDIDFFTNASICAAVGALNLVGLPARCAAAFEFVREPGRDVYDTAVETVATYPELMAFLAEPTHRSLRVSTEGATSGTPPIVGPMDSPIQETEEWMQLAIELEELEGAIDEASTVALSAELAAETELDGRTDALGQGTLRPDALTLRSVEEKRSELDRKISRVRSSLAGAYGSDRSSSRSFRYDEWDFFNARYLRHWCRLYEEPLGAAERAGSETALSSAMAVEPLLRVIQAWRPAVQAELERIRPLGYRRVGRLPDGDELDIDSIINVRADIRARRQPDERVYSRRERTHRDICAAFLVDLSASTGDPLAPPEPPEASSPDADAIQDVFYGGRDWSDWEDDVGEGNADEQEPKRKVIDVQREAIAVISAALHELGDQFGIYGFSGYGRDCVEVFVAKDPRTPYTLSTLRALACMKPKRSTRMGPAIRHTTTKLVAAATALKVLIVVSDGFPQDLDYGPNRGEHEYGVQDTAKALQEAEAKGIETFCITVDRSGHDYLRRMSSEGRYMVIEEVEDLPGALSTVYGALTGR